MKWRRFEFRSGTSAKFWEIALDESAHLVRFGRIGTDGQEQRKEQASADKARLAHDKLIAEKLRGGYLEIASGVSPSAASAAGEAAAAPLTAPTTRGRAKGGA